MRSSKLVALLTGASSTGTRPTRQVTVEFLAYLRDCLDSSEL